MVVCRFFVFIVKEVVDVLCFCFNVGVMRREFIKLILFSFV